MNGDPWREAFASPRTVAALFSCDVKTVYRLVRAGKLPHVRVGYLIRLPMRAVRVFVEEQVAGKWCPWTRRRRGRNEPR
ncbi:MAG: helix-turn-helix domain-containing protein [Planctomycetota bacterium]